MAATRPASRAWASTGTPYTRCTSAGNSNPTFPNGSQGCTPTPTGIIHIHPFQTFEEGDGARLVKFFEYGGGELTQTEMRMPGSGQTVRNGDECPDGSPGVLGVSVNGAPLDNWMEYIPADGDRIIIIFDTKP